MTDPEEQLSILDETETFREWILRTRQELGYVTDRDPGDEAEEDECKSGGDNHGLA